MSSRLDIELTSEQPDGTWTWRKAGAKQPKGTVAAGIVPEGSAVGTVLKAEADILLDGIEILSVTPPKGPRAPRHESIEVLGSGREEALVTTQLAEKGGRGRGRDGSKGRGRGRGGDRDRGRDRDRGGGRDGGRDRDGGRGPRGRDRQPDRPKPKRLRPKRTHRLAVIESLAPEQKAIAEEAMRGGIPAVRAAIDAQNERNRAQGMPEVQGDELVALAESLLPKLRVAEWRDRAEAAFAVVEELDLRDLRSVVVASDTGARDEESTELANTLRAALERRVEEEHAKWLAELSEATDQGRVVRALRVSSRPPKAGSPLPSELATKLADATAKGLDADTMSDRWVTVLDALSYSPVRNAVTPASIPAEPSEELMAMVNKTASKLPAIAALFGVDPATAKAPRRRRSPKKSKPATPKPEAAADEAPTAENPVEASEQEPAAETATATAPEAPTEAATPAEPEASAEAEPTPEPATAPEAATAPDAPAEAEAEDEAPTAPGDATEPEVPETTEAPAESEVSDEAGGDASAE